MALYNIFDISGSGMSAQNIRLNTTASNLANADSISSSINQTYRARHPVFEAVKDSVVRQETALGGVTVKGIIESSAPTRIEYRPEHPLANEDGNVFLPNVNVVEEMANMISASRTYQANVQVADTAKKLLQRTISLGQ
ncbi:MAG: flagellar basal body rod protein FlgC [Pseudomonadota bacterium]